ncbi:endonuclease/exonuclease/phosphatase family protein [Corallococcus carmarthensis]|uniref:Endonuclease/exonuclease/phosphatase family protein n=1 Tax=Corallococcus carmarthensis TaxID=2316728 RepID=A0A3A8KCJ9_9BACT|nr:endonuclease/exonuclease/phosphatase family protein [Corallococcus carmarthensis]RKH04889.1 endonuclease/exonuclease/phosphatase family protein [Corallococcus carmarthensis]
MKKLLTGLLFAPIVALAGETSTPAELGSAPAGSAEAQGVNALVNSGYIVAITHNIGGELAYGGGTGAIALVNDLIGSKQPDVVALQEVCQTQATAFWNTNAPRGYWAAFYPTKYKAACGGTGGANHGNLIAARSEYPLAGPYNLALPGNSGHGMICVDFTKEGRTFRACSTHLIAGSGPDDNTRLNQANTIKSWSLGWMNEGYRVMVGGDFNSAPSFPVIQTLNHLGNGDPFIDADQAANRETKRQYSAACNQPWNSKLDYMFFAYNWTGKKYVEATLRGDGSCSDHRALIGTARVTN